jgi:hypothetical protein
MKKFEFKEIENVYLYPRKGRGRGIRRIHRRNRNLPAKFKKLYCKTKK